MNYKLKHLSKYCCKPANELEFEAVKMAAELGGVEPFGDGTFENFTIGEDYFTSKSDSIHLSIEKGNKELIPSLDFCNKLRMSEEEAEKLEDDRVSSDVGNNWEITDGAKVFKAINGHYFKTNKDRTEVTLHKR